MLLIAFRSLAIPLVSIGLNLLSVAAAYGLVTLIFQDGHLQGPLGFTAYGGIIPWIPLFSFTLLFGLSMDYHVFILSRIRELWAGGQDAAEAVVSGIGRTAGVVTSAAVIMVAVFSIFATLSGIDVKMLGVGLAAAVLIDATVVRGVILPAALALLGERAWYLPAWLAWRPGGRAHPLMHPAPAGQRAGRRTGGWPVAAPDYRSAGSVARDAGAVTPAPRPRPRPARRSGAAPGPRPAPGPPPTPLPRRRPRPRGLGVHVLAAAQQRGDGGDHAGRRGEVKGDGQAVLERRRDQRREERVPGQEGRWLAGSVVSTWPSRVWIGL